MKFVKKIVALSLVSFIAIYGTFFYVNKYILASDNIKISSQHIETKKALKHISIYVPTFAVDVKASYDGAYIAYMDKDRINIVDTFSGQRKDLKAESAVSYYYWLPDRNRLLIAKKESNRVFELDYYDIDRDEIENITKLKVQDSKMKITDIKVSTLTNSIYIKGESYNKVKIYSLNIMKKMKKLKLKVTSIGSIEALQHRSYMIYEDNKKDRIYVTNSLKPIHIENVIHKKLLGIDQDDNVYIGEMRENKIIGIYSRAMDQDSAYWNYLELRKAVNKSDIYIDRAGSVYINDGLLNTLYELKSRREIGYRGELLQVITGEILSIDNGELIIKKINNRY